MCWVGRGLGSSRLGWCIPPRIIRILHPWQVRSRCNVSPNAQVELRHKPQNHNNQSHAKAARGLSPCRACTWQQLWQDKIGNDMKEGGTRRHRHHWSWAREKGGILAFAECYPSSDMCLAYLLERLVAQALGESCSGERERGRGEADPRTTPPERKSRRQKRGIVAKSQILDFLPSPFCRPLLDFAGDRKFQILRSAVFCLFSFSVFLQLLALFPARAITGTQNDYRTKFWFFFWVVPFCDFQTELFLELMSLGNHWEQWILPNPSVYLTEMFGSNVRRFRFRKYRTESILQSIL